VVSDAGGPPAVFFLLLRAKQRGGFAEIHQGQRSGGARAGSAGRAYPSSDDKSTLINSAWTLWLVLRHFTAPCHKHARTAPVKEKRYEGG